ncbi:MAG: hypothetical protein ACI4N4_01835 [Candidatus Fimenecus sp.]
MAKKTYTPEEYKAKIEKKKAKHKNFFDTLIKSTALFVGCALVFSATVIAQKRLDNTAVAAPVGTTSGEKESEKAMNFGTPDNGSSTDTPANGDNAGNNEGSQGSESNSPDAQSSPVATPKAQYEYFMKSFTNVKKTAKSATVYKKEGSNYQGIAEAGAFSSVLSGLMNSLLKSEEPNETYTGDDIMANFPPSGTTCDLKTSNIKSIQCKEEGDYYIITITCVKETNPTAGKGVGAIGSIITRQQIMDPISGIPGLKNLDPTCSYENVNCEAKIEKATGNMVHYYIDLPLILSFEKQGFRVGLEFKEWWNIEY